MSTTDERGAAPVADDDEYGSVAGAAPEIPAWRVPQRESTAALTEAWSGTVRLSGTPAHAVRQGLPISTPAIGPVELADGSVARLMVGGGSIEEPAGSGRRYLVLPMVASIVEDAREREMVETSGRAFAGQVAECSGWVVRVLTVNADGSGSFELLATPAGNAP